MEPFGYDDYRFTGYDRDTMRKSGPQTRPYFLDKRVLVTGSSSGIGRAVAFWYLNNGARVALVGRDKDSLTEIGKQFPSQAIVIHCDLAEDKQQYEMASGVIEKFGGLDILVNCAGAIFEGDVEKTFPQDFDYLTDINLRLPFHLISLFQPFLEKSGGSVVNVSCTLGNKPAQGAVSYCMSKAGLEMLTKSCALEMAAFGVRVNCVAPSICDTNLYRYSGYSEYEFWAMRDRAEEHTPMHKTVTPEQVGKAIVFLTSDKAKRITGQVLKVDGGRSLTSLATIDWYGTEVMNRRFEPHDGGVSKIKYYWKQMKDKVFPEDPGSKADVGSPEWVTATTRKSNWATHLAEAHEKVRLDYGAYTIDNDKNLEYERANQWGGYNNPARATHGGRF